MVTKRLRQGRHPSADKIRALRERVQAARDLNITDAQLLLAALCHTSLRVYQKWERGETKMHPAFWELLRIKVRAGKLPTGEVARR